MRATNRHDDGFTLIELMVVVLIIAVLVAIAVPSFLGARTAAQDKAAQANLRNAFTAAKTLLAEAGNYATINTTNMAGVEPSLSFPTTFAAAADPREIVFSNTTTYIAMASRSLSGKCFQVLEVVNSGASNGVSFTSTTGTCAPSSTITGSKW